MDLRNGRRSAIDQCGKLGRRVAVLEFIHNLLNGRQLEELSLFGQLGCLHLRIDVLVTRNYLQIRFECVDSDIFVLPDFLSLENLLSLHWTHILVF